MMKGKIIMFSNFNLDKVKLHDKYFAFRRQLVKDYPELFMAE